jgi:uncharacterized membrane protein
MVNQVQSENQQLQFQLGERDVEIERMKITLIALNEKLAVTNDIRLELDQTKEYFSTSELKRGELQVHIDESIERIKEAQNDNNGHHDRLKIEIENL